LNSWYPAAESHLRALVALFIGRISELGHLSTIAIHEDVAPTREIPLRADGAAGVRERRGIGRPQVGDQLTRAARRVRRDRERSSDWPRYGIGTHVRGGSRRRLGIEAGV